jgi:hypothetical protein
MKINWRWSVVIVVLSFFLGALFFNSRKKTGLSARPAPTPILTDTQSQFANPSKRASDFSPQEKIDLEKKFNSRFKPALENWCKAYGGRSPFLPSDVSFDKFHSKLAGGFYTFMIGDTTLTIFDSKKGTRVFYVMTREAAKLLNSIPTSGAPRNLAVPIKRDEVLKMVKADTGVDYQPSQVEIKPTAAACALDGGAFVEVGRVMKGDMEILTENSLSFVVSSDGKLVSYQH